MSALLFDFDGLLVDTELAEFYSWRKIYHRYGAELMLEEWTHATGYVDAFDPRADLEKKTGKQFNWGKLDIQREAYNMELVKKLPPLPGARELMQTGRSLGYQIAVVSNSFRSWVEPGLDRLDFLQFVDIISARGESEYVKPHPAPYLRALELLDAKPENCFAFEDSAPGIQSAKSAGITVYAVPNALTKYQDLSAANIIFESLTQVILPRAAN